AGERLGRDRPRCRRRGLRDRLAVPGADWRRGSRPRGPPTQPKPARDQRLSRDVLLAAGGMARLRLGADHPRRRRLRKTETGPRVKRLLGAAALAALALALVLSGGGDVGPARAASTKCVWIKHTRRVVR